MKIAPNTDTSTQRANGTINGPKAANRSAPNAIKNFTLITRTYAKLYQETAKLQM